MDTVTVFDTETTGLIANHSLALTRQPEIIEFYGAVIDIASGDVVEELHHLIKPNNPIPYDPKKNILITDDMVKDCPSWVMVGPEITSFLGRAQMIIAHNLSFDMEMVEIECERAGKEKPPWPARRICTVEQTVHLAGYRLGLQALHEYLFEERFGEAHRAKPDTQALIRCVLELFRREEL